MADELPPTQYLVLEVLAARYRLGEPYWTFPNRVRPAVGALIEEGLVSEHSGPVEGSFQVRFTDDGLKEALGAGYVTPVAAAESRGRAAGYAEAAQALADHDVQNAVALAICRQRLPWTRTVPKPIIDPENYAAFMAEAQILLAAASTAVELIASRATTEETPRG